MYSRAAALLVVGLLPAVSAPFQSDDADRLSSIKGIVTNAVTHEPLRKAYVRLEGKGGYSAITDDRGRFSLEKIEPGPYGLEAERSGFLRDEMRLNLIAGQSVSDLAIALTPQASLSGRVVDDDGEVWTHVNVSILRSAWKQGRRRLEDSSGAHVDDRGEFRVADLQPGRYYLVAEPDNAWESRYRSARRDGLLLQPTWYPGSVDVEAATPVTLTAGQEVAGLEIRLQRGAVRNVRGHLVGLNQIPKLAGQGQFGTPRLSATRANSLSEGTGYSGSIQPDGSFEVTAVPPGMYQLRVDQGIFDRGLGTESVTVDDRDVDDVTITLHPPRSIKAKIIIEGDKAPDISKLRVALESDFDQPAVVPQDDGTVVFDQLGLGRYRINVHGTREDDLYLKVVRFGDHESLDGTFSLTGGAEGSLELVVSAKGARVSGTIQQNDGVVARNTSQAVLIPDTSDVEKRESLTQRTGLDQNGSFTIHAIPPGSYSLYAAEDVPAGAWSDPEFLQEVSAKGVKLQLGEGETKNIEVPVLSKASVAPVLSRLGIE